jgi:hypothetical protein
VGANDPPTIPSFVYDPVAPVSDPPLKVIVVPPQRTAAITLPYSVATAARRCGDCPGFGDDNDDADQYDGRHALVRRIAEHFRQNVRGRSL